MKSEATAWQKFQGYLLAAAIAKRNKQVEKFNATRQVYATVQAPIINTEKFVRRGKPVPLIAPHTRNVTDGEGKVVKAPITIQRRRYVGWEYGKNYTGEKLREIRARERQNATA